mgnify:CR=1 FL=1
MKQNNVKLKDGTYVNAIMRDILSAILEGTLDEEMDEELGYSKYDYRNKETNNSRNGHSQKIMHTNYGDMEIDIPRDRKISRITDKILLIVKEWQERPLEEVYAVVISGYYPLPCTQLRAYCKTGSVYRHRDRHVWKKGLS